MQKPELTKEAVQAIIDLGELSLAFGRVNRITCHPDGVTPESDTDHTVMLGLVACAFAERFAPELDRGKIAQFALVHDFVEVYAGDTPTANILSDADYTSKEEREAEALLRLRSEFDAELPWLGETIDAYERRDTPEARFIKVIDKALPKITNMLNKGATFLKRGHDKESTVEFLKHQQGKISQGYGSDQPAAMALLSALGEEMLQEIFA
ncbi:MAG: HD domain-containing protein [Patescibacteria group bacterium]